jgi:hypothetical protein
MSSQYTLENIVSNYELLTHNDPIVRENANVFLMGFIYQDNAWTITEVIL